MKYIHIIIIIGLGLSSYSYAQEKKWTLEACMQYAIENSPRKNKQKANNDIHNQNYLEAIGQLLPSINANTNAYFNFGRGVDAETNTYTDVNSFSNEYRLTTSLVLFDGLSRITKVRMQKVNKLKGKQQLQETEDMIAYETMEAFFNVLYSMDLVKLSEQQLVESSTNLKQVKRMEELGLKGSPDIAEMAAKEASDNYSLTKQNNILLINIIKLKEKMNFPIDEDLKINDTDNSILITKSQDTAFDIF